jgi:glycosyltransferase involved in cell wall biosynthesis
MKLSICMAYYNRKQLLFTTLKSFLLTKTDFKDFEVIVVDDASNEENALTQDMFNTFPFPIKLFSITKDEKWWYSSSIPINISVRNAWGENIIIQNPECIHVGDIISHTIETCTQENYLSYHCYSANDIRTQKILNLEIPSEINIKDAIYPLDNSWYNHRIYRPAAYHFLSALKKTHFTEMGGFDIRFAKGVAFEDDEFIYRIMLKGLRLEFIDQPFCVHLEHVKFNNLYPNIKELENINRKLFQQTKLEGKWKL